MKGFGEEYKSTKKDSKKFIPSQEQIINQAFYFHSKGNILEAAKYYKYFINSVGLKKWHTTERSLYFYGRAY